MPFQKWRWAMTAFLWVQAWLALAWLPGYLPLPAPFGTTLVWSRAWGMGMMPALVTLLALLPDLPKSPWHVRPHKASFTVLCTGLAWQTIYLHGRLPHSVMLFMVERWMSAAAALTSLTLSLSSPRDNAPPALEIMASAALILTFIARPQWATILSIAILILTVVTLRNRQPSPPQKVE